MNRESLNTMLLIACLGGILYVGALVAQRPSLEEIDRQVDTIVAARQETLRALDTWKLKRSIREALIEHATGQPAEPFVERPHEASSDPAKTDILETAQDADPSPSRDAAEVEETAESGPDGPSSAGESGNDGE